MTKLQQAQALAAKGFYIFPVAPGAKRPIPKDWPNAATRDSAQIERWWTECPDANIGAHPGASGHVVIDVDVKKEDGFLYLADLQARLGSLPETYRTETPTGGAHLWFAHEGGTANSTGKLAPSIDVKSNGGYVLMAGSTVPEGEYVASDATISALPEAYASAINALSSTHERRATVKTVEPDRPDAIARTRAYVGGLIAAGDVAIEGQGGNNRTFRLACMLRDMGLSQEMALEIIQPWNEACAPPWELDELAGIIEHAYRYGQNEPGAKAVSNDSGAGFEGLSAAIPPTEAKKTTRFRALSIAEMQSLPEPTWLIDGYIPAYSTVLLYGAPGSLKSFVALDAALSLAAGRCAWGLEYDAKPLPTLYIAGEGQLGVGKQRAPAWLEHHGVTKAPFRMIQEVPRARDMMTDLPALFEAIEEGDMPRLVVIDTHTRAMSGLDENSTQDTTRALEMYAAIIKRYSCSVLVVHHCDKAGAAERGSTALRGGVDAVFRMDYDRVVRRAVLTCDNKMKDAEEPPPLAFSPVKSRDSIVLERKEIARGERAHTQLYQDIVRVLIDHRAHTLGSAMSTKAMVMELPEVKAVDGAAERETTIARIMTALGKQRRREFKNLLAPPPHHDLWMLPPFNEPD